MALAGNERWVNGIVYNDLNVPTQTPSLTNAAWFNGFLRDPDGRLVTAPGGSGTMVGGWLRTATGALVTTTDATGAQRRLGGLQRTPAGALVLAP